jgi:hypothetical protein
MSEIRAVLVDVLEGVDDDTIDYFESMIDGNELEEDVMVDTLSQFLEGYGITEDEEGSKALVSKLCTRLRNMGVTDVDTEKDSIQLLDKVTVIEQDVVSGKEKELMDSVFGNNKTFLFYSNPNPNPFYLFDNNNRV